MPNRIIKESICTSEKLNQLSDFHFRLWVSLITYVDDYGRGDARPAIIKGRCFPLRDRVTTKDIDAGLHALAGIGCINLYNVGGGSYLCFPGWGRHQRIQQKHSKYPAPENDSEQRENAENTNLKNFSPYVTVTHGESPPESNPIQSNPNKKDEEEDERENARARIAETWFSSFGEKATPALVKKIADQFDPFEMGVAEEAIRFGAVHAKQNPVNYVLSLAKSWREENCFTLKEVKDFLFLRDAANGKMGAAYNQDDAQEDLAQFREKRREAEKLERAFDGFWALYPLKIAKGKAYETFLKLAPDNALMEEILLALKAQIKQRGSTWQKSAAVWLRNHEWEQITEEA